MVKAQRGFTLLELIVVLFLIGLILALVAPRINTGLATITLKSSARRIVSRLAYARYQAIVKRVPYQVIFDQERESYYLQEGERSPSEEGTPPAEEIKLPAGLRWREGTSVIFYPNGSSSGGKIVLLNDRGKGYLIQIDVIGSSSLKPVSSDSLT